MGSGLSASGDSQARPECFFAKEDASSHDSGHLLIASPSTLLQAARVAIQATST